MAKKRADPVDKHVGERIRLKRLLAGLSLCDLARPLGISIEQVRHYETGFHRIGAGRLYAIAKLLCVDVSWFFEGAPGAPVVPASERAPVLSGPLLALCQDRGAVALLRAFNAIEDQGLRASIAALVGATAAAGETVH